MIKYLSYIYDMRKNNGVPCTKTTLCMVFKVDPKVLYKDLGLAFKKGLLESSRDSHNIRLTLKGQRYVENYRSGKTDDRNDEK